MSENRALVEKGVLGKEVEFFMNSDVGRYLQDRILNEKIAAIEGLSQCDPFKPEDVQKWQNQMRLADHMTSWLQQAVHDGLNAINVLESRE